MVIPRDLYYILNRQSFTNAPLCRACSNDNESIAANQFASRCFFLSQDDIEILEGDNGRLTVTATVGQVGKNDDGDLCAYIIVMDVEEVHRLDSVAYVDQDGKVRVDYSDLYDPALVTPCMMSEVRVDPWPDVRAGDRVVVEIAKTTDDNGDRWFTVAKFKEYGETYDEALRRLIEERRFQLAAPEGCDVVPPNHRESEVVFGAPGGRGPGRSRQWTIKFEPYAFHTGDRQPLPVEEARKLAEQGEDLELMHIPIGREEIPFGENFYTLTDCNFESVVGEVRKPIRLTWGRDEVPVANSSFHSLGPQVARMCPTPATAQKIELLQRCMVGMRILDSGYRSKEKAKEAFSRLLVNSKFYLSENDEDFFWLQWDPMAYIHKTPDLRSATTTTFVQIPIDGSETAYDYHPVELRVLAAHEGDKSPIPTAKAKAIGNTEIMQIPLGHIHWISEHRHSTSPAQNTDIVAWEKSVRWTWTEDWEEPSEWAWADGWEEPTELTWKNVSGFEEGLKRSLIQRIVFMRHYLKMIYIEDTGELDEQEVVASLEELVGIELRHGTDSQGRDYWWKVQRDG